MKLKGFLIVFVSFVLTTSLLYIVGYMFTIPPLMFHHQYTNTSNGFFISTGSLLPIIIGLVISFAAEKIYLYKQR
ncbi:hypothetical protein V7266_25785 [Neobacillus drentensis]|uniref:hypothetical protein n=1 Tax=Neobacillus drentensis TaxID=220684 RepID=UPI002FFEE06B